MTELYDASKLSDWLTSYKKSFNAPIKDSGHTWWQDERFKWIAVKHFQDNWDIDSSNFPEMLKNALSKTNSLLDSQGPRPRETIIKFAQASPNIVQSMFTNLFNENKDVFERIEEFKNQAEQLRATYTPKNKDSYQDDKAISTYLWLRYPDKYYTYKYKDVRKAAEQLGSPLEFKKSRKGRYEENLRNFYQLYDSLNKQMQADTSLRTMLDNSLDAKCYPDPFLKTLTFDFGFYVSRMSQKNSDDNHPEAEAQKRSELPKDENIIDTFETPSETVNYWWLNASPKIWSFAETPIGETQTYTLYNENGNKRRIFQNFLDVQSGDIIIGYEANPIKQIVALAEIVEGSDGQKITFKKTESLASPIDYQDLKALPELTNMEFFTNPNGSLFKVSPEEYSVIMDMIRGHNPAAANRTSAPYDKEQFLAEVFLSPDEYEQLARVLKKSKNLILQGAPGTGKTFTAKRLAYAMMGTKDDSRIRFVQFHQNYSYEDFVMGYKPEEDNFRLKTGIFYEFCKTAESHPTKDYFFIIDEINRGNISKIFGELLMLIESSHRGEYATLTYNGLPFAVPKNLYLIGMMNTADRSLAMIDYALRRRFFFYEMEPAFHNDVFKKEIAKNDSLQLQNLIEIIQQLNDEIEKDPSLGRGFRIGHSYFCNLKSGTTGELADIVDFGIVPMLEEYWFDDADKVAEWKKRLEAAIQ